MKQLLAFLMMITLLLAACDKGDQAPDLSQAKPGEKITLSEDVRLEGVPYSVVPYGSQPALAFTDLKLSRDGDTIQGKANFTRQGQDDFTLVVYLSMADELLITYLDSESNLTMNLPGGMGLFGANGYELSGDETGAIEFWLTAKVFNGYDVTGKKGTVYFFAVPGTVNSRSSLPADQTDPNTYQASSNVLERGF